MLVEINAINAEVKSNTDTNKINKEFGKVLAVLIEQAQLKQREAHPAGHWDSKSRFYLLDKCWCCKFISQPTKTYNLTENKHGRTLEHVAGVRDVDFEDVKRVRKFLNNISKELFLTVFNGLSKPSRNEVLAVFNKRLGFKRINAEFKITDKEAKALRKYINKIS